MDFENINSLENNDIVEFYNEIVEQGHYISECVCFTGSYIVWIGAAHFGGCIILQEKGLGLLNDSRCRAFCTTHHNGAWAYPNDICWCRTYNQFGYTDGGNGYAYRCTYT